MLASTLRNTSRRTALNTVLTESATKTPAVASLTGSVLSNPTDNTHVIPSSLRDIQVRTVTKRRVYLQQKRLRKAREAAAGIEPNKPGSYIPRHRRPDNSFTRQEQAAEAKAADMRAAQEMQRRVKAAEEEGPLLRHQFNGLVMSDRVKKLFDMVNGSQMEVVAAQKQRGMELFQTREADTGSSAVQSKGHCIVCVLYCI